MSSDPDERWRSIHGRVLTASGNARGDSDPTSRRVDGAGGLDRRRGLRARDLIDGDKIIGFSSHDGSPHELVALFNAEARRSR